MKPGLEGKRFFLLTLGCFRNEVESDLIRSDLSRLGMVEESDVARGDLVVVNTCGFIEEACSECIDTVLELGDVSRRDGLDPPLVLVGCMAQRYGSELLDELPEVSGVLGVDWPYHLEDAVVSVLSGRRYCRHLVPPSPVYPPRKVDSSENAALYIRISDGCNRFCSFCAVPSIRGRHKSRPMHEIMDEIERLSDGREREVVLIAQDLTSYGNDLDGKDNLPELISMIAELKTVRWVRLLYLQPEGVTEELIETVIENPKVCDYFDLPFQHASRRILRRMGRPGDASFYMRLVDSIRARSPEAALRTTVMVGFPGETESDFLELVRFIEEIRFDWLGAFRFSAEGGTAAASMPGKVGGSVSRERYDTILELQDSIEQSRVAGFIGSEFEVVIDGYPEDARFEAAGRSYREAPVVDGLILIRDADGAKPGDFRKVRIVGQEGLDLVGEVRRTDTGD